MAEAADVLERPVERMIKNPGKMIERRDKLNNLYYTRGEKEAAAKDGVALPDRVDGLRQGLDRLVTKIEERGEPHEQLDAEGKKKIPDFVLRHEESWESIGWSKKDREEVKNKLRNILHITDENALANALDCIVGAGRTPEEALRLITEDAFRQANEYASQPELEDRQRQLPPEEIQKRAQNYMLRGLGVEDIYVRRFILNREYNDELQYEFDNKLPDNLFDLAWNISFERQENFGINGKFPILQMQVEKYVDKKDGKEKVRGRYVVNQANWMRWMRDQINWWYEQYDTDEVTDYFSKVEIKKGPYTSVNLVTMLFNYNRYFRDETGFYWERLYDQTLLEPWMMFWLRTYHLEYDKAQSSEEKLSEAYNNIFYLSKLTRKIYGKSMVNILMTLPEDFEGKDSDAQLGDAWRTMFMVYYNMADFEALERTLGADSPLFKRQTWLDAMIEVGEGIIDRSGMPVIGTFMGDREEIFAKAFDVTTGKIKDKDAFIKFLNIFPTPSNQSTALNVINQVLKDIVADKVVTKEGNPNAQGVEQDIQGKIKDKISLDYAWLLAHSWTFFTGAAAKNNFPGVSGHLAETKWQHTAGYRAKYAGYSGGGNQYTIRMFPQLMRPLLEEILVENDFADYHYYDEKKGEMVTQHRNKTPMEILMDMNEVSMKHDEKRKDLQSQLKAAIEANNENEEKRLIRALNYLDEVTKNDYKILAGKLEFNEHAMRYFAQNVIGRAKVVYETIMGAHEINFEKFTKYDSIFRGVSFDRAEWQKAIQGGMVTPLRYLFQANGAIQYNMIVRSPVYTRQEDGKYKWVFKDVPLGEAMFGHQILDIPEFRTKRADLTDEEWRSLKAEGYRRRGQYILRPDGKHRINYDKVQDNQSLAYKQWMLMKIGADLWSHIDRHSTDPAYNMEHYLSILEAIENLPGDIEGNEFEMRKARIPKGFFSHHQMKWLKKISGTTTTKLFTRQFAADLFVGDQRKKESMFGESASIVLSSIFRGYQ